MNERSRAFCIALPAACVLFNLAIAANPFVLTATVAALAINIAIQLYDPNQRPPLPQLPVPWSLCY